MKFLRLDHYKTLEDLIQNIHQSKLQDLLRMKIFKCKEEMNPEENYRLRQEMMGYQGNAARKIGELRQLPEEVQIKSKLKIEREIRN